MLKKGVDEKYCGLINKVLGALEKVLKSELDSKEIYTIMTTLEKAQKAQRLALGLDKEEGEQDEPGVKVISGVDEERL